MDPAYSYLDDLLFPVTSGILQIDNIDTFQQQTEHFPESVNDIRFNGNLETYKKTWYANLKEDTMAMTAESKDFDIPRDPSQGVDGLTPWDLMKFRDEEIIRILGPPSDKIQTTIFLATDTSTPFYSGEMTEELAAGISLGLRENIVMVVGSKTIIPFTYFLEYHQVPNYQIRASVNGQIERNIDRNDPVFTIPGLSSYPQDADFLYSIDVYGTKLYFLTFDFVTGLKTAANWMNLTLDTIAQNMQLNIGNEETGVSLPISID